MAFMDDMVDKIKRVPGALRQGAVEFQKARAAAPAAAPTAAPDFTVSSSGVAQGRNLGSLVPYNPTAPRNLLRAGGRMLSNPAILPISLGAEAALGHLTGERTFSQGDAYSPEKYSVAETPGGAVTGMARLRTSGPAAPGIAAQDARELNRTAAPMGVQSPAPVSGANPLADPTAGIDMRSGPAPVGAGPRADVPGGITREGNTFSGIGTGEDKYAQTDQYRQGVELAQREKAQLAGIEADKLATERNNINAGIDARNRADEAELRQALRGPTANMSIGQMVEARARARGAMVDLRDRTDRRGQDTQERVATRGQDIHYDLGLRGDATQRRGQDVQGAIAGAHDATTRRGQDMTYDSNMAERTIQANRLRRDLAKDAFDQHIKALEFGRAGEKHSAEQNEALSKLLIFRSKHVAGGDDKLAGVIAAKAYNTISEQIAADHKASGAKGPAPDFASLPKATQQKYIEGAMVTAQAGDQAAEGSYHNSVAAGAGTLGALGTYALRAAPGPVKFLPAAAGAATAAYHLYKGDGQSGMVPQNPADIGDVELRNGKARFKDKAGNETGVVNLDQRSPVDRLFGPAADPGYARRISNSLRKREEDR